MRGSVEKRGKGYSIRIDLGKDQITGKRIQKRFSGFQTKREAEAELARIIAEYEAGTYVMPQKITLGDFLQRWFKAKQNDISFTTSRQYKTIIEQHITPAIGHIELSSLQPLVLQEYLNDMLHNGRKDNKKSKGKELSPSSVNYIYRVLRCALNDAVKWRLIQTNPALSVNPPPARGNMPVMLSPDDVNSLLNGLKNSYLYLPAYIAVHTGMRLGEVLALTWDDVDFENGTITIKRTLPQQSKGDVYYFKLPKTKNSQRTIPASEDLLAVLKTAKREQEAYREIYKDIWHDNNLVCCNKDGTPLHPPTVSSAFPKTAKKLGYNITFHSLRDIHAGLLLQAGVPLKVISTVLGHGSGQVAIDKYIGFTPQITRDSINKMSALLKAERRRICETEKV